MIRYPFSKVNACGCESFSNCKVEKVLGNNFAANRIFNAISIRYSRRLRNSLRSDILAEQKRGLSPFLLALEERTPMAKSTMAASGISQNFCFILRKLEILLLTVDF
jgi:hypothetical protein